ncbi:MAG: tripartite tricarboxylate transporter TctB family protein [Granulosicoccus sp.]
MKRGGEALFVAVLIIFSAAALWQSYGIAGFSKWSSPGVFPMLASATMLICAIFILRNHYQQNDHSIATDESSDASVSADTEAEKPSLDSASVLPRRVVIITLLLVFYVVAMPTLGFLLCSGLFLLASITYLWNKPLWQALLVSAVALVVIHVVFRQVFQVILPRGTLIEWLL